MITLAKKLRKELSEGEELSNDNKSNSYRSVRDRLLFKEIHDLQSNSMLPETCKMSFPDPDELHEFQLTISPAEGLWKGGKFLFHISVTEGYNFSPPNVKCSTRLWHPNINEEGAVCLSLLRRSSIDELGWAPTRTMKDVVWGLNSLFTDLLNFEDPLNQEASKMYANNKAFFQNKVTEYIRKYC